jgi:hypothetical protein
MGLTEEQRESRDYMLVLKAERNRFKRALMAIHETDRGRAWHVAHEALYPPEGSSVSEPHPSPNEFRPDSVRPIGSHGATGELEERGDPHGSVVSSA